MKFLSFLAIIIAFYLCGYECIAQDRFYKLSIAGKEIGMLRVFDLKTSKEVITQKVESEFKFLFQSGKFVNESSFAKGKLIEATSIHSVNGNLKENTITRLLTSNHYQVLLTNSGQKPETRNISNTIHGTLTGLFYAEPHGKKEVYSERFGVFCPIRAIDTKTYEVKMPDGKKNIYTYEKGACTQVQTELVGFKLLLKYDKSK